MSKPSRGAFIVIVPMTSVHMRSWDALAEAGRGSVEGVGVAVWPYARIPPAFRGNRVRVIEAPDERVYLIQPFHSPPDGFATVIETIMPGVTVREV